MSSGGFAVVTHSGSVPALHQALAGVVGCSGGQKCSQPLFSFVDAVHCFPPPQSPCSLCRVSLPHFLSHDLRAMPYLRLVFFMLANARPLFLSSPSLGLSLRFSHFLVFSQSSLLPLTAGFHAVSALTEHQASQHSLYPSLMGPPTFPGCTLCSTSFLVLCWMFVPGTWLY